MRAAVVFALVALHLSMTYTSSRGWANHAEWAGDRYDCLAHSLISQGALINTCDGNTRAYRLPGYPLVLAGMFIAFGDSEPAARLLQSVLASMIVFLAAAFTARLGGNGTIAGIAALSSLMLYREAALLQTELVFAFMLVLFVIVLVNRHYLTAGGALGLLLLTRGTLLFAAPLFLFLVPRRKLAYFLLPVFLIVGAWTARNYLVLRAIIPFSTGSGAVLWGANNPVLFSRFAGSWLDANQLPGWQDIASLGEVQRDQELTARAIDYLHTVPAGTLVLNEIAKLLWFGGFYEGIDTKWPILLFGFAVVARFLLSQRWRQA